MLMQNGEVAVHDMPILIENFYLRLRNFSALLLAVWFETGSFKSKLKSIILNFICVIILNFLTLFENFDYSTYKMYYLCRFMKFKFI